ncbi:MAG: tetratricopeptide repeat protein [Candidatus Obscuribacterales bacterium]|nr:tetratricopeptide repeat protein [Candidatus Obscuribacterales bacterium]
MPAAAKKMRVKSVFLFGVLLCSITSSTVAMPQLAETDTNWKAHEYERFSNAGREAMSAKNYAKAAVYFEQALTFKDEADVAIQEGKCYMRMGMWSEARKVFLTTFEKRGYGDEFGLLVECDLKLKLFDDALARCDSFQKELPWPEGTSWLQRSKVYLQMGKRQLAVNCLKEGYYHCVREGRDVDDIKYALAELNEIPPSSVPKVKTGNSEVLALLRYLASLKGPVEEQSAAADLERVLKRKLNFVGNSGQCDWRADDWASPTGNFELTPEGISFGINADLSYVTKAGVIAEHISPQLSNAANWKVPVQLPGTPVVSNHLECVISVQLENGSLNLCFNEHMPEQLLSVGRSFSAASVEQFASSDFDKTIKETERLNQLGKHEEATKYLVRHWQSRHIDLAKPGAKEKVATIKKLLIESLCWNPGVAKYVEAAPYLAVTEDIVRARFDSSKLPTINKFSGHRWVARTVSAPDRDGPPNITTGLSGYQCGCWLTPDMPLYKIVAEQVVDRKPFGALAYIKPISGQDADDCMFKH